MRVTCLGSDVAAEVVPPCEPVSAVSIGLSPVRDDVLEAAGYSLWTESFDKGGSKSNVCSELG